MFDVELLIEIEVRLITTFVVVLPTQIELETLDVLLVKLLVATVLIVIDEFAPNTTTLPDELPRKRLFPFQVPVIEAFPTGVVHDELPSVVTVHSDMLLARSFTRLIKNWKVLVRTVFCTGSAILPLQQFFEHLFDLKDVVLQFLHSISSLIDLRSLTPLLLVSSKSSIVSVE
jgi:hypothetical protein